MRSKKIFFWILFSVFIVTGFLPHCSNPAGSDEREELQEQQANVTVMSGNHQVGRGGEQLTEPIVIAVTDSDRQPLADISINFVIVEGEGTIIDGSSLRTDRQGRIEIRWQIGPGYNGIEASMVDEEYTAYPGYICAQGENPRGMFRTRTVASLTKIEFNFYTMTFYGDYSDVLDSVNNRFVRRYSNNSTVSDRNDTQCSLFSALGNSGGYFFGRSFDNPIGWNCITLLARYNPPDGYASLAFARTREIGIDLGSDIEALPFTEKTALFEAAFYTPDGINEAGVAVGCAGVRPLYFVPDPKKKSIFLTLLVREILDHAGNVDEAVEIARQYNVFDNNLSTLATHYIVADSSGRSVILELHDGVLQAIPNRESWQVATNSPVYNVPLSQRKADCRRYTIIYDRLESAHGNLSEGDGMNLLERVMFHPPGTQWSSLYDLIDKRIIFALNCNFERLYRFSLD